MNEFRVRISTAILLTMAVFYPFTAGWILPPNIPTHPELLHKSLGWLFHEMPIQLLFIAVATALVTGVVLAFKRMWWGVAQCFLEIVACLVAAILIPAY